MHANGRVLDPSIGRFLSVDPVYQAPTNSQSVNPYSYVMNNPLSLVDPSGYTACNDVKTDKSSSGMCSVGSGDSTKWVSYSVSSGGDVRMDTADMLNAAASMASSNPGSSGSLENGASVKQADSHPVGDNQSGEEGSNVIAQGKTGGIDTGNTRYPISGPLTSGDGKVNLDTTADGDAFALTHLTDTVPVGTTGSEGYRVTGDSGIVSPLILTGCINSACTVDFSLVSVGTPVLVYHGHEKDVLTGGDLADAARNWPGHGDQNIPALNGVVNIYQSKAVTGVIGLKDGHPNLRIIRGPNSEYNRYIEHKWNTFMKTWSPTPFDPKNPHTTGGESIGVPDAQIAEWEGCYESGRDCH